MPSVLLALSLAAHLFAANGPVIDYLDAYRDCTKASRVSTEEALAKCEAPARGGVPGAQYVMGAFLTNRGKGDDIARGIEWLEKAAAAGSPPAAYHLALVLLAQDEKGSAKHAGELLRSAVCAGYPPAVEALAKAGRKREELECPARAETDFNGNWTVSLKWETPPDVPETTYKLSIANDSVRVSMKIDGKWTEVKKGTFTVAQHDETMTVASTDSGWDHDGKWIESWTFQLLRTGPDVASAVFMRTVNNPNMPAGLSWRTMSSFAKGTAQREKQ